MAINTLDKRIVEEGHRNAIVRLTGVLGISDANWGQAITLTDFVNNDTIAGRLSGLRVDTIDYACGDALRVGLYWDSASPQVIALLSQSDVLKAKKAGGLLPDQTLSAYTGSINLVTSGYPAGTTQGFTILLYMVKLYTQQ